MSNTKSQEEIEEAIHNTSQINQTLYELLRSLTSQPKESELRNKTIQSIANELVYAQIKSKLKMELQTISTRIRRETLTDSVIKNATNSSNKQSFAGLSTVITQSNLMIKKINNLYLFPNSFKEEYLQWYSEFREVMNHRIKELKQRQQQVLNNQKKKNKGYQQKNSEKSDQLIDSIELHLKKLDQIESIMRSRFSIVVPVESLVSLRTFFKEIFGSENQDQLIQSDQIKQIYDTIEGIYEEEVNRSTIESNQPFESVSGSSKEAVVGTSAEPANSLATPVSSIPQFKLDQRDQLLRSQQERAKGNSYMIRMLEQSFSNQIQLSDLIPPDSTKQSIVKPKSNLFPKHKMLDENIINKLDIETLFFTFYFQKNSFEQYQAAKKLKRLDWRYHKKYMTWFQRLEVPKVQDEEHEEGTYLIFDYEKGWVQRKKCDFNFKYQYLEDELK